MDIVTEQSHVLDLLHKYIKSAIINIVRKIKETTSEKLKESMTMMFHEMQDINKEMIKKRIY